MTQAVRTAAQADKDVVVFKALANPVRLQIVSFVAASPEGQVSAGQIVERFSLSQPTISHHLRVLREAGVLTTYKTSTFVYYRFAPQLRETVAAVLPDAAAAEPPAVTTPVRKSPRAATKKAESTAPREAANASETTAAKSESDMAAKSGSKSPAKSAPKKAAKRGPRKVETAVTGAPEIVDDPQVEVPGDEPVDAGPVMPIAEPVEPPQQETADDKKHGKDKKHDKHDKHDKSKKDKDKSKKDKKEKKSKKK